MKQYKITREQQQRMPALLTAELEKVTMSWDNELRDWHTVALKALRFVSPLRLNIPQENFIRLLESDKMGINMNVAMYLCNNIEIRTPDEMDETTMDWARFLLINANVAKRWNELAEPFRVKIFKMFESENNQARILQANVPMKMIKGEA